MTTKGHPTLIDRSRRATIHAAADFFEGLAQLKRHHKRAFPDDRSQRRRDRSDFLLDLLRLNVDYVNRVAELSKEHHRLATRSLERLYNIATPRIFSEQTPELVFGGAEGAWERAFTIENKLDSALKTVRIRICPFQGPKPSRAVPVKGARELKLGVQVLRLARAAEGDREVQPFELEFDLDYRKTQQIRVELDSATFQGRAPALYSGEFEITIGDRIRRIPLTVDMRTDAYV